jgi:hypothetical protein
MAEEDLLVHVHILKTAGTSLWYWMARRLPGRHGFLYPQKPLTVFHTEDELTEFGIGNQVLRAMSSHHFRVFPEWCAGRRMRYFTVLRDPLRQFLSYLRYVPESIHEDSPGLPSGAGLLSSRELTAWLLDQPQDVPFRENFQTNYLASHVWRAATGRGPAVQPDDYPTWDPPDWADYRQARLGVAKDVLRNFGVVGTVERMDESLAMLASRAAAWDVPLGPPTNLPHINTTSRAIDLDWIHDDDPVGRRLLASLAEDRELYAFANELLDEALALKTPE